jgi:hypothetical protein
MGGCMSGVRIFGDLDEKSLAHTSGSRRNDEDYFQYADGRRFHNEKNCPYPLPNDLTEIDR